MRPVSLSVRARAMASCGIIGTERQLSVNTRGLDELGS